MLLWATASRGVQVKVIKWSSTSIPALETLLKPLYAEGWKAALYGNGYLILEKP